jgi:hypothetical protein
MFDDFCLPDDVLAAVMDLSSCQLPAVAPEAAPAEAPNMFAVFLPAGPLPPPFVVSREPGVGAQTTEAQPYAAQHQPALTVDGRAALQHTVAAPDAMATHTSAARSFNSSNGRPEAAPPNAHFPCMGLAASHELGAATSHPPVASPHLSATALQPQDAAQIQLLQQQKMLASACQRAEGEAVLLRARMEETEQRRRQVSSSLHCCTSSRVV